MKNNSASIDDIERLAKTIRTFIRVLLVSGRTGQPARGLIPFNPLYFHFLGYLLEQGQSRPSAVAEYLGVPRSTLSTASKALQSRGLLHTDRDPDDGRAQLISLTDSGVQVANAIREQDKENMKIMLSFIEPDERENTLRNLEKVAEKLESFGTT